MDKHHPNTNDNDKVSIQWRLINKWNHRHGTRASGLHWSSLMKSAWSTRTCNVKDRMSHFLDTLFQKKHSETNTLPPCSSNFKNKNKIKRVCHTYFSFGRYLNQFCACPRSNSFNWSSLFPIDRFIMPFTPIIVSHEKKNDLTASFLTTGVSFGQHRATYQV